MTHRKPTIGFLATGLDEQYQITLRMGVLEGIRQAGGRVLSLPGIPAPAGAQKSKTQTFAHQIVSSEIFDGLIVLSATFSGYLNPAELAEFCENFAPVPLLSVGLEISGIPSIEIDNRGGMTELMEHLFFDHGYVKPAFIGGPHNHPEAITREAVFREVLARKRIVPDERLITHTGFNSGGAELAMKEILSKGIPFDCVVCASDTMALEAEAVLDEANRTVPELCALTGFDNISAGSRQPFSLSTVHQPLHEMGKQGAEMIIRLIEGETIPNRMLNTQVVIRKSCGCPEPEIQEKEERNPYPETVLRQKETKRARLLRMIGVRLLGALDRKEIQAILSQGLWDLETGYVTVSIIPEEFRNEREKKAETFYCFDPLSEDPVTSMSPYPIRKVFPPGFPNLESQSWIICPLNFSHENLGYMIFEDKPDILDIYYILSLQLANSIKVWELEQKRRNYTEDLEKMISERTRELQEEAARRQQAEKEMLAIAEREQRRIGQDLHDDICQSLAGISVLAKSLERNCAKSLAGQTASKISLEIRDVIGKTKSLSRGLFPVILEQQGLTGALEELTAILDGQKGPAFLFYPKTRGPGFQDNPETALHLYRIAQEAAHNALKHSGASRVTLFLEEDAQSLCLKIEDNGSGFPTIQTAGLGLSTMRYRACLIQAELQITSTGNGTSVVCRLAPKRDTP